MAEWIYFIHPPRDDFAATMTEAERDAWDRHWTRIKQRFAEGSIVVVGPTLGRYNTGICIFEAPDEATATAAMLHLVSHGNIKTQTARAFDAAEMEKIVGMLPK